MRRLVVVLGLAACGRLGFDPLGGGPGPDPLPPVAVIAGGQTTCSIVSGKVSCWGANNNGLLADGTNTPSNHPVRVPALDGTTSLALGYRHACAVRPDGKVWCWGSNDHLQLGDDGSDRLVPAATVTLPAMAVQVAVGDYHTCALLETRDVWCWGKNTAGQIGIGTVVVENRMPERSHIDGVDEIIAGGWSTCARKASGEVWCWGQNSRGQLGRGAESDGEGTPAPIANLVASHIAMADGIACALESGHFRCWGFPYNGQLGTPNTTMFDTTKPLPTSALGDLDSIAVGAQQACATTTTGAAYCWGTDEYGQLGNDGAFVDAPEPVGIAAIGLSHVTAGAQHACAVKGDQIVCWGRGSLGQLGDGKDLGNTPQPVVGLGDAQAVGVGNGFSCATTSARVRCWGANAGGELGHGDTMPSAMPLDTLQGLAAYRLSVGPDHACAVSTADNTARCWGSNGYGQLGNGTTDSTLSPLAVPGLWDTISSGDGFTCGLRGGAASCWGINTYRQLGDDNSLDHHPLPGPVLGITGLQGITTGGTHACAWDGTTAWCWGNNGDGQLGLGDLNERPLPAALSGPPVLHDLTSGTYHSCGLDPTGEVYCWGNNGAGQLALTGSVQTPTMINFGVSQISAGGTNTCAIATTGLAYCFGDNSYGQLGDGLWAFTNGPKTPTGLPPVASIAINGDHACALVGPAVYCWGNNDLGQLGRGTMTSSPVPVVVAQ